MQATPMQLVFGRDAIMNLTFDANWHLIKMRKQEAINKNNAEENSKRIQHEYKINDQVLVKNQQSTKFGEMMLNKQIIKGQQYPSLGCNIKWHPWNSPEERA